MNIKLVISDIDGVWTDGGMYYDQNGNELKKFNTYDSAGVLFLKRVNIPLVILTGEETRIVESRMKKLQIADYFQGCSDKWSKVKELLKRYGVESKQVAYLGDDLNDLECLKRLKWTAVPKSAPDYIKDEANWVLSKKGGEGVFREFVEKLLKDMNLMEIALRA